MENNQKKIKDGIVRAFGYPHMDTFHEYPGEDSNVRYYHRLKASICIPFLIKHSGNKKTFLDAGAGRGPYTYSAKNLYEKIFCYEYDLAELQHAKNNIGNHTHITFDQVDLTNIPLGEKTIDVAVCSEVLEHIPDIQKAVAELYRVLKPGGVILFSMPNKKSLFYRKVRKQLHSLLSKHQKDYSHSEWEAVRHISFSPKDIESYITSPGLKIYSRFGANVLPLPTPLRKACVTYPILMFVTRYIHDILGKVVPQFGSFYFVAAQK